MNLQKLWQYDLQSTFDRLLEDAELGLTEDRSDFVFVDGEEGDYGVIRYTDASGQVVAVRNIEGGDAESIELTDLGKPLVARKMLELFRHTLAEKLMLAPEEF
jgi:hypothetical protein